MDFSAREDDMVGSALWIILQEDKMSCPLSELCKCNGTQICLFCKILTILCVAVVSGVIGYFIGRKKK